MDKEPYRCRPNLAEDLMASDVEMWPEFGIAFGNVRWFGNLSAFFCKDSFH